MCVFVRRDREELIALPLTLIFVSFSHLQKCFVNQNAIVRVGKYTRVYAAPLKDVLTTNKIVHRAHVPRYTTNIIKVLLKTVYLVSLQCPCEYLTRVCVITVCQEDESVN